MSSNPYVDACPAGWLLEALDGHPLDALLFPRSHLWWRYYPEAWNWVIHFSGSLGMGGLHLMCPCLRGSARVVSDPTFTQVHLSAAVVWRNVRVTESRPATLLGRKPPDQVRFVIHERLFWAGQCPECSVIYWTVSPWVEKPRDKCANWHEEYKRQQADKDKEET